MPGLIERLEAAAKAQDRKVWRQQIIDSPYSVRKETNCTYDQEAADLRDLFQEAANALKTSPLAKPQRFIRERQMA